MNQKVFIVGAKRSPIGAFLGTLKDLHPVELGTQVLKQLLADTNVPKDKIDEVIVGNVIQAGLGQNIARQISIKAGLSNEIPAYTLNMVCGSGMKSVMNAYVGIQSGFSQLVVAGGVESMSGAPYVVTSKVRDGVKMGSLDMKDTILQDALHDSFTPGMHMGITAENIAAKHQLTREELDGFALGSQQKAIQAVDSGRFSDEIVPIEIKTKKETIVFSNDEYPNRGTNAEKMAKLRPAFKNDGLVTAGSSSGINDGASFMILASEAMVKTYNLPVLGEIVAVGQGGVDPNVMGLGPVPAIKDVLQRANMKLSDMELLELNEAFAAQSLGVVNELAEAHGVSKQALLEKTNVNGGAIALGHPVGVSGNRIIVTLIHELKKQDKHMGLASLCIGGGMGTAIIVKR
ncbi:acetyl-CoA C-acetyltransferase [Paracholeplasma manati]|uniref:acetyl-CoA C-acetyltransferase n=1 Tax=Paracholeplasma manati TaxID=591373 RepID=A0ABT2Y6E8_9MOLU|nr:acetyl-CoA C-acetyltransferase [Paracholeplasma manati]MCV2232319.1 acetyl-CoA C-acetyltransferase [Paracholeplasma manati]MDG0888276.1 acetyl-CoA C-acetyltransferase [Paracholeplasma manati]